MNRYSNTMWGTWMIFLTCVTAVGEITASPGNPDELTAGKPAVEISTELGPIELPKQERSWSAASVSAEPKAVRSEPRVFRTALARITCLAISPDSRQLAVGGLNQERRGSVELLDWETGRQRHLLPTEAAAGREKAGFPYGGEDQVRWLDFSPDSKQVVAATNEGFAFWHVATGERLKLGLGSTDQRSALGQQCGAFSPDGLFFASGTRLSLWDVKQQAVKWTKKDVQAGGVVFSPDGRLVATAEYHNRVHLWQTSNGVQVGEVHAYLGPLYGVAFDRSGAILAACGEGGVRLWDLIARGKQYEFREHPRLKGMILGAVHSMALSGDGERLATCGGGLAKVWNVVDSRELATAHRSATCLAFSPDGDTLVIAAIGPGAGPQWSQVLVLPMTTILDQKTLDDRAREAATDLLNAFKEGPDERGVGNALFALGPHSQAAVPVLVQGLADKRIAVRIWALQALCFIGPAARDAASAISERLADEAPEVRQAALMALDRIAPEAAAQARQRLATQPRPVDQPELRDGMWYYQGRSLEEWLAAMPADPLAERTLAGTEQRRAVEFIQAIGPQVIPTLIAELDSKDPRLRTGAASALSCFGKEAKVALGPIEKALAKDATPQWYTTAYALAIIVKATDGPVPRELSVELRSADPHRIIPAARAVLYIDKRHEEARNVVMQILADIIQPDSGSLRDQHASQDYAALAMLRTLGSDAAFAVPGLVAVLEKGPTNGFGGYLRANSVETLGSIGPAAREAVPALLAALKDRDLSVRAAAARELARLTPDRIPEELVAQTAAADPDHQRAAFWALQHFGEKAIGVLSPLLKDSDPNRRRLAIETLVNTGAPPREILPLLKDVAANDPDPNQRQQAAHLIESLEHRATQESAHSVPPTRKPTRNP